MATLFFGKASITSYSAPSISIFSKSISLCLSSEAMVSMSFTGALTILLVSPYLSMGEKWVEEAFAGGKKSI